jgi:Fe2+ or Zn2+ uptake regulation protein
MGLVRANRLPGEGTTYELADEKPHIHLVCQRVTHMEWFLPETTYADLQTKSCFHSVSLTLSVTGYCPDCWEMHNSSEEVIGTEE